MSNTFENSTAPDSFPVILMTGLSGAGKSSAMNVLEDLRFLALDGIPPMLLPNLLPRMLPLIRGEERGKGHDELPRGRGPAWRGLVVGLDPYQGSRPADPSEILDALRALGFAPSLVFMEASTEAIIRRYAATRRPHPLTLGQGGDGSRGLEQAIQEERSILENLRGRADLLIDTTKLSIHDLRRLIQKSSSTLLEKVRNFRLHLVSFGFKYGIPSEADMMHDLRFLPNPHFVEELRPRSGLDQAIAEYVIGADPGRTYCLKLEEFLRYLIPLYEAEGRFRLTVAFGCTGGRHRSVAVTERMADILRKLDYVVSVEHRHLELG